jgi:hypothetical protein
MNKLSAISLSILLAISVLGCKKGDDSPGSVNYPPLIPESTGWEKVGTVKYTYLNRGFPNTNSMEPVELMKAGTQMHLLYSENYQLTGLQGRQFYKGKFTVGTSDTAQTFKISLPSGTDERTGLVTQQLIPESFAAIALNYRKNGSQGTLLHIMNETGQELSNHFVGHDRRTANVYSNGDVLTGTIDYSAYAELDFYNKAANGWTYVKGTSHDTTALIGYTPFRLPDGSLNAFNITVKDLINKSNLYLSIANPRDKPVYPTPLYRSQFLQPMPELEAEFYATAYPKIIASKQEGDVFTVVVGSYPYNSQVITKLYAYQWVKGATTFTKLYSAVAITEEVHNQLKNLKVQCQKDGTIYYWAQDPSGKTGAITTIDASGVHSKGAVTFTGAVLLGALNYIEGSYYAVVYPFTDQLDMDHSLHMDIVKLK